MAREVKIEKPKSTPIRPDLLARATGASKRPQTPPPAKPLPPGVDGNPPLPPGRIVSGIAPSSLTPQERETLESVGWSPDVPIPNNMAELLSEVQAERRQELGEDLPPPIDPRTPKLTVQTKSINELSPQDQASVRERMRSAFAQQEETKQQEQNDQRRSAMRSAVPGLEAAAMLAAKSAASFEATPEEQADAIAQPATTPAPQLSPAAVPVSHEHSDTGADAQSPFCVHCGWDRRNPDIPEPKYQDKMAFLHSVLGQKAYTKNYPLFGGRLTATFRTLTTKEVDIIYSQAYSDKDSGKITTDVDFWELLNRNRLFLQLSSLKGDGIAQPDLPDGYSPETNPSAEAYWKTEDGTPSLTEIEEYLVTNLLKTEFLFRTVNNACNQFNRLVAKMEAMADNSDFWNATEEQS